MTQYTLVDVQSTASGHGLAAYSRFLEGCPKKAAYFFEKQFNRDSSSLAEFSGFTVGSIGHAILELFFNRDVRDTKCLEFSETVNVQAVEESKRCAEMFIDAVGGNNWIFGEPLKTEVPLPASEEKSTALGIQSPCTGAIDLMTKMSQEHVELLQAHHEDRIYEKSPFKVNGDTDLLAPGYWIIDHKFYGALSRKHVNNALHSLQFANYYMQAEHDLPDYKPLRGTIQNTIFKYKTKTLVMATVIAPPTEAMRRSVRKLYNEGAVIKSLRPHTIPSDNQCLGGFNGSECPLFDECKPR